MLKKVKKVIGHSMNRTCDLLLCIWTTFQYALKADDDSDLAVVFKLLYILYDKSSHGH